MNDFHYFLIGNNVLLAHNDEKIAKLTETKATKAALLCSSFV